MPQREPGVAPPTMRDVAEAAGVSKALVSIVFRGVPGASEETRARVMRVAGEIGYHTNRTASLLARRRTKLLGVTLNVRNPFHAEVVEAIQVAADDAGYDIVLSAVGDNHQETRAVATLLEFRCESVILLGSALSEAELADLATSVPVVLIGRRASVPDVDVVRAADGRGQRLLVDHLVALGHRRIVHIDGGTGIISADRRRGFRAAMRRHGLVGEVVTGGADEGDGWRAAGALFDRDGRDEDDRDDRDEDGRDDRDDRDDRDGRHGRHGRDRRQGRSDRPARIGDRPTAVTAFNDSVALGAIGRLAAAGVDVPGSVSVVGFDDSPVARFAAIDLTTVNQNGVTQAAWAVRASVQRLEESRRRQQEWVLDPILVVRGTTAPPSPGA